MSILKSLTASSQMDKDLREIAQNIKKAYKGKKLNKGEAIESTDTGETPMITDVVVQGDAIFIVGNNLGAAKPDLGTLLQPYYLGSNYDYDISKRLVMRYELLSSAEQKKYDTKYLKEPLYYVIQFITQGEVSDLYSKKFIKFMLNLDKRTLKSAVAYPKLTQEMQSGMSFGMPGYNKNPKFNITRKDFNRADILCDFINTKTGKKYFVAMRSDDKIVLNDGVDNVGIMQIRAWDKEYISVKGIKIYPEFQGEGLGSCLYELAVFCLKRPLKGDIHQSKKARDMWASFSNNYRVDLINDKTGELIETNIKLKNNKDPRVWVSDKSPEKFAETGAFHNVLVLQYPIKLRYAKIIKPE